MSTTMALAEVSYFATSRDASLPRYVVGAASSGIGPLHFSCTSFSEEKSHVIKLMVGKVEKYLSLCASSSRSLDGGADAARLLVIV
jgi:hypothetical protein